MLFVSRLPFPFVERLAEELGDEPDDSLVNQELVELHGERSLCLVLFVFDLELPESNDLADPILDAILLQEIVEVAQSVLVIRTDSFLQVFDDQTNVARIWQGGVGKLP